MFVRKNVFKKLFSKKINSRLRLQYFDCCVYNYNNIKITKHFLNRLSTEHKNQNLWMVAYKYV